MNRFSELSFLLYICSSDELSSSSVESLVNDFHVEPAPEAWSVTMDRTRLQSMSARDIKRQDHIWGDSTQPSLTP